jgi:hypothetical protein
MVDAAEDEELMAKLLIHGLPAQVKELADEAFAEFLEKMLAPHDAVPELTEEDAIIEAMNQVCSVPSRMKH